MLLSDIKRKHNFKGRTETKISFQGEINQQGKHEPGPQDQNTSSIKESMKKAKGSVF